MDKRGVEGVWLDPIAGIELPVVVIIAAVVTAAPNPMDGTPGRGCPPGASDTMESVV